MRSRRERGFGQPRRLRGHRLHGRGPGETSGQSPRTEEVRGLPFVLASNRDEAATRGPLEPTRPDGGRLHGLRRPGLHRPSRGCQSTAPRPLRPTGSRLNLLRHAAALSRPRFRRIRRMSRGVGVADRRIGRRWAQSRSGPKKGFASRASSTVSTTSGAVRGGPSLGRRLRYSIPAHPS